MTPCTPILVKQPAKHVGQNNPTINPTPLTLKLLYLIALLNANTIKHPKHKHSKTNSQNLNKEQAFLNAISHAKQKNKK